jgi:hypothetical protein
MARLRKRLSRRRRRGTIRALRRVRDDAYRVHDALDAARDAMHEAAPGAVRFGNSLRRVRTSLGGSGADLAELGRCLLDDARRIARV